MKIRFLQISDLATWRSCRWCVGDNDLCGDLIDPIDGERGRSNKERGEIYLKKFTVRVGVTPETFSATHARKRRSYLMSHVIAKSTRGDWHEKEHDKPPQK